MIRALWVRLPTAAPGVGVFVTQIAGDTDDPITWLTAHDARRLAAQLTAAADQLDPRPAVRRGRPPYGWRHVRVGTLEPDLAELEILDRLATYTREGYTRRQIADAMNALDAPTPRGVTNPSKGGRRWKTDTVRQLVNRLRERGMLHEQPTRPIVEQPTLTDVNDRD